MFGEQLGADADVRLARQRRGDGVWGAPVANPDRIAVLYDPAIGPKEILEISKRNY